MSKRKKVLFHEYFSEWIDLYKVGAVRDVTLAKYKMTLQHLIKIAPDLELSKLLGILDTTNL